MNKHPLTKKQIIKFFKKQKNLIMNKELLSLQNSQGRFLFTDLKSKVDIPPFNNSAVDGYALLEKDLNKKKIFYCNRKILAGSKKNLRIKSGEIIRVFTGAKMPSNSSTIVMQENTIKNNNKIKILKIPSLGDNYRLKGEDIKKNKKILLKGSQVNQKNINLIAATGIKKVEVYKKINISVRKFLKNVGITSQRKIEEKIRDKFKSGEIKDINKIKVKATITSDTLELNESIDGEIET